MNEVTAVNLAPLTFVFLLFAPLWGQSMDLKGQLWGGVTSGNNPAPGHAYQEETVGYIPTLSVIRQLGPFTLLDMEWSYRLGYVLDGLLGNGQAGSEGFSKLYRLWGRYATEKLEVRVGLQKIAFGPGRILRPLMWFDTFDLRDPTGQTEGVSALRVKYFPVPQIALWGWVIRPDNGERAAPGGRVEYTFGVGEAALTFHQRRAADARHYGPPLVTFAETENRLAFDLRVDVGVGLWTEMVLAQVSEPSPGFPRSHALAMIGGDYTFPWGQGLFVTVEHLWDQVNIEQVNEPSDRQATTVVADLPLGLLDRFMGVVLYDWEEDRLYRYLLWQRGYDYFSLNLVFYANPKREKFSVESDEGQLPETLAGFGTGFQIMLIYHH